MTLTARILVGENCRGRLPFPDPGIAVGPRILDLAATQLVNNDRSVPRQVNMTQATEKA